MFNRRFGVAVAGSHGKTTTTAWLGYVLDRAGLGPSVMVGAYVPQFDSSGLVGQSDYLVIEADEYQNKLRWYAPHGVVLNNIDYDHPDFFPSVDDYIAVFVEFIKKIPKRGFLVANFDDPGIRRIARVNCRGRVVSYGIREAADYIAYDIRYQDGRQYFKVKLGVDEMEDDESVSSGDLGDFSVILPGEHNIYNALAVIAAAVELGIDLTAIRRFLPEFSGTARRLEVLGDYRGATIVDDYAHHPTEIKAALSALRQKYGKRRLVVAFHPHTFTRTKALLDEFALSFDEADELIILDIYGSAREAQGVVSAHDLADRILEKASKRNPASIRHIPGLKEAEEHLRETTERGDVVVLMGAGDVFRIGENLLK